ncbi:hypothetical protein PHET_02424 [Paragonimus heterotremus]|uniref:Peptidase S54 rhomboid domain-containing protein n=1 Tax=Paragonimus heterotremus TaxID=100268 RepID=A0A8J4TJJ6_9TREM|nr:hypothetical protein PHET_02424 [Paragonimus heterotremus]
MCISSTKLEHPHITRYSSCRASSSTPKQIPVVVVERCSSPTVFSGLVPENTSSSLTQSHELKPCRPIFTYLTCALNIGIFIFVLANSHIATFGITGGKIYHIRVRLPNMTKTNTCWFEYTNPWVGPRPDELVRFGALYSPCVRFNPVLRETVILPQIEFDRASGCCILALHDACYQTGQEECRNQPFSTWINYRAQIESRGSTKVGHNNLLNRVVTTRTGSDEMLPVRLENTWGGDIQSHSGASSSPVPPGPVCGLDPRFCSKYHLEPGSVWSNTDVTKWPICEETSYIRPSRLQSIRHMHCQVTAHPCCVGLRGECQMTTEAHCKRIQGHYNPQAAMCSQVNCLQKNCGMTNFRQPYQPDQLYRLITSLFLHAGFIHLWLTVTFQLTIMRTMEIELGWFPISVIYILSGCFGNAVCILLLPYQITIGPSPALISLIGVQVANTIRLRSYARTGSRFAIVCGFFLVGLMPWIENVAHIGGLVSGMLSAFIVITYQQWQNRREPCRRDSLEHKSNTQHNAQSKNTAVKCNAVRRACSRVRLEYIVSLIWLISFLTLITLCAFGLHFYCTGCVYLSCLPFTSSACKGSLVDPYKFSECVSRY